MSDFPTDAEARGITDYVQAHSFDDAQCAGCGTVRWKHAAHFLDFLAPLIRAREAAAWGEGWTARADRPHLKRGESVPPPTHINPYTRQEADNDRD